MAWCAQLPPGCMVAMEACSQRASLGAPAGALGLDARLIAAHFVSPYRMEGKSGKNDATDAAAICEAASRPSMRFVPIKTCEQQGVMSVHRVREGFKEERTACINRIRGVLAEFGLVFAQEPEGAAGRAGRRARGRGQRTRHARPAGAAARIRALARARRAHALVRRADRRSTCAADAEARQAAQRHRHRRGRLRRRWWPASATSSSSGTGAQFGAWLGWCRARTPAAARPTWGASPSEATTTCARC